MSRESSSRVHRYDRVPMGDTHTSRDRQSDSPPATAAHSDGPITPVVLSVVVPTWNEEAVLREFHNRTAAALDMIGIPWELIIVDDGSTDDTSRIMRGLRAIDRRVRYIRFSRNFGQQAAITAGLDFADGQAVVVMDADLQDPPEVIQLLHDKWREGYDVVLAVRKSRDGENRFKLWTAKLFYRLLSRLTSVSITLDSGDFRLMDRRVVLQLRRLREHHRFMRGLSSWVGFRQAEVAYDRSSRFAGATKYPVRKLVRLAMDAITSFSFVPLQLATFLGLLLSVISLISGATILAVRIAGGAGFLVGQTTTLLAVLFLGGIQLLFIGVIGEYLGRTYDEVRDRPLYLVMEAAGFCDDIASEDSPTCGPASRAPSSDS